MNDTTKGARRVSDEAVQRTIDTWSEKRIIRVDGFKRDVFNLALDLRDERAAHAATERARRLADHKAQAALKSLREAKAALAALVDMVPQHVRVGESYNADLFQVLTAAREVCK